MSINRSYGFVGMGNMGFAMLNSAVKIFDKSKFLYTDISSSRLESVKEQIGVSYVVSNNDLVGSVDVVVLAVKPQYMKEAIEAVDLSNFKGKTVITIAAGITIEFIKNIVGQEVKVVRAMPNTPALIGQGITAIAYSNDEFSNEEKEEIESFFNSFGEMVVLREEQLDMVVPVSGSSPAYVYMFIEAMADAGVLVGLPRDVSYKLAAKTVQGAAQMLLETGQHPGVLKDQVTSPNGTTIEAVKSLEKDGFRGTVIEAMKVCYDKAKKMQG